MTFEYLKDDFLEWSHCGKPFSKESLGVGGKALKDGGRDQNGCTI